MASCACPPPCGRGRLRTPSLCRHVVVSFGRLTASFRRRVSRASIPLPSKLAYNPGRYRRPLGRWLRRSNLHGSVPFPAVPRTGHCGRRAGRRRWSARARQPLDRPRAAPRASAPAARPAIKAPGLGHARRVRLHRRPVVQNRPENLCICWSGARGHHFQRLGSVAPRLSVVDGLRAVCASSAVWGAGARLLPLARDRLLYPRARQGAVLWPPPGVPSKYD